MKNDLYKQCEFTNENTRTVAWIEEKYAKVGIKCKFTDVDDGIIWEIASVNDKAVSLDAFSRKAESFKKMTSIANN